MGSIDALIPAQHLETRSDVTGTALRTRRTGVQQRVGPRGLSPEQSLFLSHSVVILLRRQRKDPDMHSINSWEKVTRVVRGREREGGKVSEPLHHERIDTAAERMVSNGSQNTDKYQVFAVVSDCGQIAYTSNLTIEQFHAKHCASWLHNGASPHDPAFLREHRKCIIGKFQDLPIDQYWLKIR